jgi:hypothetical protein
MSIVENFAYEYVYGACMSRAGRSSGTMLGHSSSWLAAALMYCAIVCDVAGAAPPTTMAAFLESKLRQQEYVTNAVTPALGSLRTKYAALPKSCEVLIKVNHRPAAPHQCTHPLMLDRSVLLFVHTLANVLCCPRGHERVCVFCSEAVTSMQWIDQHVCHACAIDSCRRSLNSNLRQQRSHARFTALATKVLYSSVNPSDRGPNVAASTLPHVLGSDVCGTVVAAETNCTRLKVGDRVWGDIGELA